jgi:hypothetical protein
MQTNLSQNQSSGRLRLAAKMLVKGLARANDAVVARQCRLLQGEQHKYDLQKAKSQIEPSQSGSESGTM